MTMRTTRESVPQTWLLNWVTGRYYPPPFQATLTTGAMVAANFYCNAHYVPNVGGITATSVGIEVTTAAAAGNTARIGFYKDLNGRPEELLLDAGTVATDAIAFASVAISQTLPQGWIWVGVVTTSTPTVRAFLSGAHISIYSFPNEGAVSNAPLTYLTIADATTTSTFWNTQLPELHPGTFGGTSATPAAPTHTTGIPRTLIGV